MWLGNKCDEISDHSGSIESEGLLVGHHVGHGHVGHGHVGHAVVGVEACHRAGEGHVASGKGGVEGGVH